LSSHELNQPGTYKDVKDTSAVALFQLLKEKNATHPAYKKINELTNNDSSVFFMAWTTTPWTLPSNLGLTVGANIRILGN